MSKVVFSFQFYFCVVFSLGKSAVCVILLGGMKSFLIFDFLLLKDFSVCSHLALFQLMTSDTKNRIGA